MLWVWGFLGFGGFLFFLKFFGKYDRKFYGLEHLKPQTVKSQSC